MLPWSHETVSATPIAPKEEKTRANIIFTASKQPRVRINAESVFENLAYEAKAGHPIEEVQ